MMTLPRPFAESSVDAAAVDDLQVHAGEQERVRVWPADARKQRLKSGDLALQGGDAGLQGVEVCL